MYGEEEEEKERQGKECIEVARGKLRGTNVKRAEQYELEENDEVDIQDISENLLGFAILVGFGVMVLYRYVVYGFI